MPEDSINARWHQASLANRIPAMEAQLAHARLEVIQLEAALSTAKAQLDKIPTEPAGAEPCPPE
jgi:hypothetical protein